MDPILGKYINLIQIDSDRATWKEFLEKVKKLGYKERDDFKPSNTGNPSAYFKAEVANHKKVKALRDKYKISSFGIESIDPVTIYGDIQSGLKVFLKETKEIGVIGQGKKNEFGYVIIKEDGTTVRRGMHEFVVLTEDIDVEELKYNPYAVCTARVGREDSDKYHRCIDHVVDAQTEAKDESKKSLDEMLSEAFGTVTEHHLDTREDKVAFILDKTKNSPAGGYDAGELMSMSDEDLDSLYNHIEQDLHLVENDDEDGGPYETYEDWCDALTDLGPGIKYKDFPEGIKAYQKGKEVGKWDEMAEMGYIYDNSVDMDLDEAEKPSVSASYIDQGIKFIPIEGSNVIQAVGYDDELETMYIRFKTGVYEYYDVPEEVYRAFLSAPSMGKFFHNSIRKTYVYNVSKKYAKRGRKAINESEEYEAAKAYVEYLLGGEYDKLYDTLGLDMPRSMEDFEDSFDRARELGIEYYVNHPEEVEMDKIMVSELQDKTQYFNPSVEKLAEEDENISDREGYEYAIWRDDMETFISKNYEGLSQELIDKYDLDNMTPEGVHHVLVHYSDEQIQELYNYLKRNSTIDIHNGMNEKIEEIFGFDKEKSVKGLKENIKLKINNFYDIEDPGDGEIKKDFKYIGQANSGEYIFKYSDVGGDIFILINPDDLNNLVKPSLEETTELDDEVDADAGETAGKFNADFSDANDDADEDNMEAPEETIEPEIPEIVDFRTSEDELIFTPETEEHAALDALESGENGEWEEYTRLMKDAGITVKRDDVTGSYKVNFSTDDDFDFEDEEEEELDSPETEEGSDDEKEVSEYLQEKTKIKQRFAVEESAKSAVKKIVEGKGYKFVALRGSLVESKQKDLYELIVEKNGNSTSIVYNDSTTFKPWSWNKGDFQHLQEALDAVYIPFKKLVNETAQDQIDTEVKQRKALDEQNNKYAYNTDKLPLEEQKRRAERGQEIFDKLMNEDLTKRSFNR